MGRVGALVKFLGGVMLAFGLGILLAFFLPDTVLIVIEAIVIIGAGALYLCKNK